VEVELRFLGSTLFDIAPTGLASEPKTMPDAVYVPNAPAQARRGNGFELTTEA
jgi:hypothetical protein